MTGQVFQSAAIAAVAGVRNLLANRTGSLIGAMSFEDPAGFGAFDLVGSKKIRFRQ